MKVELKRDTIVRFSKGAVLEVSEEEASRLIAFGNAVAVEKEEPKKAESKRSTKKRSE